MTFFNINLVIFITQSLYFSKRGGKLTFKASSLKLDAGPYKKLNKRVKDFKD